MGNPAARAAYAARSAYLAELATWTEARHRGCAVAAGLVPEGGGYRTRDGRWRLLLVRVAHPQPGWEWLIYDRTEVQCQGYPTGHPDLPGALRYAITSLQDEAQQHTKIVAAVA